MYLNKCYKSEMRKSNFCTPSASRVDRFEVCETSVASSVEWQVVPQAVDQVQLFLPSFVKSKDLNDYFEEPK